MIAAIMAFDTQPDMLFLRMIDSSYIALAWMAYSHNFRSHDKSGYATGYNFISTTSYDVIYWLIPAKNFLGSFLNFTIRSCALLIIF